MSDQQTQDLYYQSGIAEFQADLATERAARQSAETDAAALREAARALSRTAARQVTGYDHAVVLVLRTALNDLNRIADQDRPGARLLAEVEAARAYLDYVMDTYTPSSVHEAALRAAYEAARVVLTRGREDTMTESAGDRHPERLDLPTPLATMVQELRRENDRLRKALDEIDHHEVGAYEVTWSTMPEPCEACVEMREIAAAALAASATTSQEGPGRTRE